MNPKKDHEVGSLVTLIQTLWPSPETRPKYAMDLGSGRAHLSRTLARPPLSMHVCAVDSSDSQLLGAERLDSFYERQSQETIQLDHRLRKLDSPEDITTLLNQWTSDVAEGETSQTGSSPLVVALHACGDLSVHILRAFASRARQSQPLSLVLVSCCYNMLSDSSKIP